MSGCATSGAKFAKPHYPELPADLRVCFETQVAPPSSGVMTKKRVIFLIAELKKSETEKNDCGKRLVAFYDNVSH